MKIQENETLKYILEERVKDNPSLRTHDNIQLQINSKTFAVKNNGKWIFYSVSKGGQEENE